MCLAQYYNNDWQVKRQWILFETYSVFSQHVSDMGRARVRANAQIFQEQKKILRCILC